MMTKVKILEKYGNFFYHSPEELQKVYVYSHQKWLCASKVVYMEITLFMKHRNTAWGWGGHDEVYMHVAILTFVNASNLQSLSSTTIQSSFSFLFAPFMRLLTTINVHILWYHS